MIDKKSMKILLLKQFTGPPRNGAEKLFLTMYEILRTEFRTEVIDCMIIKFDRKSRLYALISFPISIVCANMLALKYIRKGYQVYPLYTNGGTITIIQGHNHSSLASRFGFLFRMYGFIDFLSRFGRNRIRLAIYVSNFMKERNSLRNDYLKEYVIYPPVIESLPNLEEVEKEDLIITISRIAREKKLDKIGEILNGLPFKHILIGFSSDKEYLEEIRKSLKNTIIIPDAPEELKNQYLKKAKIFLNTSENEPFGMVLVEALSYGVVTISHCSGGPKEILPNEYLYNTTDEAREIIKHIMSNYNELYFNKSREISKKFTKDNFKHELIRAIRNTFKEEELN